jgi:hypothetical protein
MREQNRETARRAAAEAQAKQDMQDAQLAAEKLAQENAAKPAPAPQQRQPAPPAHHAPSGGNVNTNSDTELKRHRDDRSLQGAGNDLAETERVASAIAAMHRKAEEAEEAARKIRAQAEEASGMFVETFQKRTTHLDTSTPASKRVVADLESVGNAAKSATTSQDWQKVATLAAPLHTTMKNEHDTDYARAYGERAPISKERIADAEYAVSDGL